jgi:hypothetical protein
MLSVITLSVVVLNVVMLNVVAPRKKPITLLKNIEWERLPSGLNTETK